MWASSNSRSVSGPNRASRRVPAISALAFEAQDPRSPDGPPRPGRDLQRCDPEAGGGELVGPAATPPGAFGRRGIE